MSTPDSSEVPVVEGFGGLERIGRGGFSTVYSATQSGIDRRVAIKVLDNLVSDDARFLRECRTLGSVSDVDGIVGVLQATFSQQGHPCIVMQLMGGGSLSARIQTAGPLTAEETVAAGLRLSSALSKAHRQRVYHRDIKPENVLFDQHGEAAIADFGIALVEGVEAGSRTIESLSPPHAPPERFSDTEASPELGDVYSLASTLYTALSGSPPFGTAAHGGMAGLINRVLTQDLPPLPSTGSGLMAVLATAMSKDPSLRPSMEEFHAELLVCTTKSAEDGVQGLTVKRASAAPPAPGFGVVVPSMPSASAWIASPPPGSPPSDTWYQTGDQPLGNPGTVRPLSGTGPVHTGDGVLVSGTETPTKQPKGLLVAALTLLVAALSIAAVAVAIGLSGGDETAAERTTTSTSTPRTTTTTTTTTTTAPRPPVVSVLTTTTTTTTTTSTTTTTVPVALPTEEATAAVHSYLEAGASFDTEYFVSRWRYPVELYYSSENVSEEHIRQQSEKYWEDKELIDFDPTGSTEVTAVDGGWSTSTRFRATFVRLDGTRFCSTQTIDLVFDHEWLVRRASERNRSDC